MEGPRCTWYQGPSSLTFTVFESDENNLIFTKGAQGFMDSTLWKDLQARKGKQKQNQPTNRKKSLVLLAPTGRCHSGQSSGSQC